MRPAIIALFLAAACNGPDQETVTKTVTVTETITTTVTVPVPIEDSGWEYEAPPEPPVLHTWFEQTQGDYVTYPGGFTAYMGTMSTLAEDPGTIWVEERTYALFASPDANILIGDYAPASQWTEDTPLTDILTECFLLFAPTGQMTNPAPLLPDGTVTFTDFEIPSEPVNHHITCYLGSGLPPLGTWYGLAFREADPPNFIAYQNGEMMTVEVGGDNGTPTDPLYALIVADAIPYYYYYY